MELLTVKDLSFQKEGYFAFKHVTFSLSQNQAISITGDSGSGKSALLENIVGLEHPDSGSAQIHPGANVGFMPQVDPQQIDSTVGDYLETNRLFGGEKAVESDQLKDMAAFMGIRPYFDRRVNTLSKGYRQRVDFLVAVATRPNVLILDSPFSFQNAKSAHNMVEIFKDLQSHGSGVLVTGPIPDMIIEQYFDKRYSLTGKMLQPYEDNGSKQLLMAFKATEDSMAMTREMARYSRGNFQNIVELKVPSSQKDKVIETMLEMNYLFEGMVNLEV